MSNDHPNQTRFEYPWHIIKGIVGYTDYYSRFALRLVSKEFKKQVDRLNCRFEKIDFKMQEDEVSLEFTSNTNDIFHCIYKKRDVSRKEKHPGRVVIEGPCPVEMAVCRLATVFRNPETTVKIVDVHYSDYAKSTDIAIRRKHFFDRNAFLQTVQREMSTLPHRLHIEQLSVQTGMNELEGLLLLELVQRATLQRLQFIVYPIIAPEDWWKLQRVWSEFGRATLISAGRTLFEMHFDESTIAHMPICLDSFGPPINGYPLERVAFNPILNVFIHAYRREYVVHIRAYRTLEAIVAAQGLNVPSNSISM